MESELPDAPSQVTGSVMASEQSVESLRQTRPWVLLFSILTFGVAGLLIVGGIFMVIASLTGLAGEDLPWMILAVVYPVMGIFYIIPARKLYRYANRITSVVKLRQAGDLDEAIEAQKSFWKSAGILSIVASALWVVVMIVMFVVALVTGGD